MNVKAPDALSAVIARHRGRARLRTATLAVGAASLVTAGAVAYHLPGATHTTSVTAPGTTVASGTITVHTTSGGSGVTTSTSAAAGSAGVSSVGTGRVYATSGGS